MNEQLEEIDWDEYARIIDAGNDGAGCQLCKDKLHEQRMRIAAKIESGR